MSEIDIEENSSQEQEENTFVFKNENESGFTSNLMIHQDKLRKISKTNLSLDKKKVFNIPNTLSSLIRNSFSRKNEIFYCVSTKEMSIDINDVSGKVYLPLLTKQEIEQRLSKMKPEVRKTISMVHFGAVKILLKAQFRQGIDSPVKMALIDDRIRERQDCILGAAKGNLAYGKFMFTVYPKFGISLQSKDLNKTLSFIHQFERDNLMNKGNKVFSITYMVGYALTNSHHSIDYKANPNIELDEVFQEIGKTEEMGFCELSQEDADWALDIAQDKPSIHQQQSVSVTGNNLISGRRPSSARLSSSNIERILRSTSTRIDRLGDQMKLLTGNE